MHWFYDDKPIKTYNLRSNNETEYFTLWLTIHNVQLKNQGVYKCAGYSNSKQKFPKFTAIAELDVKGE